MKQENEKEKGKGVKKMTQAAECSKAIKAILKKAFPGVKFSVRSENFSGGNSVDVDWENGPTSQKVNALVGKHESGTFDGMTDCYNYDNLRKDIPQAKYIMTNRDIPDAIYFQALEIAKNKIGGFENIVNLEDSLPYESIQRYETARQYLRKTLSKMDIYGTITEQAFMQAFCG